MKESTAGYTGAITLILGSGFLFFTDIKLAINHQILLLILTAFLFMLIHEFIFSPWLFTTSKYQYKTNLYKSAAIRHLAFITLAYIPYFVISNHYYYTEIQFKNAAILYQFIFLAVLFFGYPYILFTLKYKGNSRYDFNDYGILFLLAIVNLFRTISRKKSFLGNRRIKKIFLVMAVNFFFLTLMAQFSENEYVQFSGALHKLIDNYDNNSFFQNYHTIYLTVFHLLFVIDVGIAVIGYSVASRWLGNRTKSVDMTFSGWMFALLCYPPMNSGFSESFIGYGRAFDNYPAPSEPILMVLMVLILACYFIYVWATITLGFKFSNLTNRGIITGGAYQFFRHPAYTTKNTAWWLDNVWVFHNVWAVIGLGIWNYIYFMRGITEEKNLIKDKDYRDYQAKTKYKFLPGVY